MTGAIHEAALQECLEYLKNTGGTVIHKNDYQPGNMPTYGMPLVVLDVPDATDTGQYLGGSTHVDWLFAFNSYNYMPDPYGDDKSKYSISLYNFMEDLRIHFSVGIWLTPEMYEIENLYNFRFTLSGIQHADALEGSGLNLGYKIVFDSIAIDNRTNFTKMSESPLERTKQFGYPSKK